MNDWPSSINNGDVLDLRKTLSKEPRSCCVAVKVSRVQQRREFWQ